MIIAIKFNIDALHLLSAILDKVYYSDKNTEDVNLLVVSITFELSDKFDKKFRSEQKKPSLFDTKKKFKMNLKYYEAWALNMVVAEHHRITDNVLHRAILFKIHSQLDPKLQNEHTTKNLPSHRQNDGCDDGV